MTDTARSITSAAAAVMQALEPLAEDERERVLLSAAALYGFQLPGRSKAPGQQPGADDEESHDSEDTIRKGKRLSLVEFLNQKKPATNAQRIASFAYYREHIEGKGQTFPKAELKGYFATAKLSKPAKYDRDWNTAVTAGWIHDDGDTSYLTQGGEDAVEAGFDGKARPRGSSGGRKARKAAKTAAE